MKTNKMAVCSINIVEELYSLIDNDPYETDVQMIDADTQPNLEELKKVKKNYLTKPTNWTPADSKGGMATASQTVCSNFLVTIPDEMPKQ